MLDYTIYEGPLTAAEAFFAAHAGVGYHPAHETFEQGARRGARELASAEAWLASQADLFTARDDDPMPWDGDVSWNGPLYVLSIWRDNYPDAGSAVVAALGSVAAHGPGDPYLRVCYAEMASELR